MTDKIVVLSTCGSEEEARRLAHVLIERRLAACVNITAPVTSVYRWKGSVEEAQEWQLIIKSRRELFEQLRAALELAHSYELPEVLAVQVIDGSPNYLAWVDRETRDAEVAEAEAPPEREVGAETRAQ